MSDAGEITRSTERMPILDVAFRGQLTLEMYQHHLDEVQRILETCTPPIVILLDMTDFNPFTVTAQMRKSAADAWAKHKELMVRSIAAEARIILSPLARGVMTAFDWLTSTPGRWPCKQFASRVDAELWLRQRHADVVAKRG